MRPRKRRAWLGGLLVAAASVVSGALALGEESRLSADYWRLPLPVQGEAPAHWPEIERTLAPEACGACHADQFADWRTSLHAKAFSPGLVGQLLAYSAEEAGECMNCHAPLAEQKSAFAAALGKGAGHRAEDQGLAASGNSCAGCHLRGHRRFGPPQRGTGAVGPGDASAPHGGAMRTADFERAEFCAACHQFPPDQAVNGKPLQNTVEEWRASPQAARGETCQSCHMPGRRHLWRGIHDPEMVSAGVTPRFSADRDAARFSVVNSGVGHAFPTYVTPKVLLRGVMLDEADRPISGSQAEVVIGRRVEQVDGNWVERSDTRLLPGASIELVLPWKGAQGARLWLEVAPDDFYDHEVYDGLLAALPKGSPAAQLIAEADRRARQGRFRLFETVLRPPPEPKN